jgi:hypothetical protein
VPIKEESAEGDSLTTESDHNIVVEPTVTEPEEIKQPLKFVDAGEHPADTFEHEHTQPIVPSETPLTALGGDITAPESQTVDNLDQWNKMIETAISKKIVTLYSNHRLKRDFMHISDVTDSILAAAKYFNLLNTREFYYVGSESLYSYDDLAEILKEILYEKDIFISKLYDFNKLVTSIEMRAGSIDSSLFRDITNWKSKYKLKDGLLKAINDYSINK